MAGDIGQVGQVHRAGSGGDPAYPKDLPARFVVPPGGAGGHVDRVDPAHGVGGVDDPAVGRGCDINRGGVIRPHPAVRAGGEFQRV
jgi:hypothetical protein